MSTKKLQIVTPIVTSVNGETGDVTIDAGMEHPIILEENTDYGDTLPSSPVEGQLFFKNATSGLSIAEGGTGATTASEAIVNLGGLPLTGGTMVNSGTNKGRITIPGIDSAWRTARDNAAIKVGYGGDYTPALSMKNANCTWDIATYSNNLEITKFADSVYTAGTNTPKAEFIFSESGLAGLQSTRLVASGTLSSSNSISGTGDMKYYRIVYVMLGETLSGANQYYSFICPYSEDRWGIYLPSSSDYYRARVAVDSTGKITVSMLSSVTRSCYIYVGV